MLTKVSHLKLIRYWCAKTEKKSPPESTHGKSSFWVQIQNGRHYTESNIEMDITLDLSKMETQMTCPFLLIIGFQII